MQPTSTRPFSSYNPLPQGMFSPYSPLPRGSISPYNSLSWDLFFSARGHKWISNFKLLIVWIFFTGGGISVWTFFCGNYFILFFLFFGIASGDLRKRWVVVFILSPVRTGWPLRVCAIISLRGKGLEVLVISPEGKYFHWRTCWIPAEGGNSEFLIFFRMVFVECQA